MAVAVAPDALGASDRRALVRGDFVISPNVPTFLAPGDETEVSVSVANNVVGSGANAGVVTLVARASGGLEILDGTDAEADASRSCARGAPPSSCARAPRSGRRR
jgi:uncharacterized protein YfaS (alpha-2-macroglobulin family)